MRLRSSVVKRRTGLLFHWDHRDGFTRQGKPVTVDGIEGTFTRASIKTAVDSNGRVYTVPSGQPAMHHRYNASTLLWEPAGGLLEKASTNLVLRSQEFDNATWSKSANITITANAIVAPDGTTTADLISNTGAAGSHNASQAVTFTGDGVKCCAVWLKGGTATQTDLSIHDSTAGVSRHVANVAWSGGVPTPTTQSGSGTIHAVERFVSDWYRILFSADGIVAANSNAIIIYPTGTGSLAGNVYAWGVQAEDSVFPTSYIATTSATVTRAVDAMEFPALWLPKDVNIYAKHAELGTFQPITGAQPCLLQLGDNDSGTASSALIRAASATVGDVQVRYENASGNTFAEITSGAVAIGDTQEIRLPVLAAGFTPGRSINAAAEVLGAAATALAHATTYAEQVLCFTPGGPFVGAHALQSVKIADGSTVGERTMAQMREAF